MLSQRIFVAIVLAFEAFAARGGVSHGDGIPGSPHDFSSTTGRSSGTAILQWTEADGAVTTRNTGTPHINPETGVQGIAYIRIGPCTKCHLISHATSARLAWNPELPIKAYAWDDPVTTAGTQLRPFDRDTFKGPTALCLTCHDGLLASADGNWFYREGFSGTRLAPTSTARRHGRQTAPSMESVSAMHPIAMPYPYYAWSSYNLLKNSDGHLTDWVVDPSVFGIRLYNDDGAGNITRGPVPGRTGIECSSCHDVHNSSDVKDAFLLTFTIGGRSQSEGDICPKCHVK